MSDYLPISTLKSIVFGDDVEKGDVDDDAPNPFEQLRHDGAVRAALGKSNAGVSISTDWLHVDESDVDADSFELQKSPTIIRGDERRNTLAKKLGITRTEQVTTENGDVWVHAFNSSNELVDARLINSAD